MNGAVSAASMVDVAGRFSGILVSLIGRRVPYERFTPYLTQFAPAAALVYRHETVYRFFHTTDRSEAVQIARELGADHVCLYDGDRLRFEAAGFFDPVYEEAEARCYHIRGEAPSVGSSPPPTSNGPGSAGTRDRVRRAQPS